MSDESHPIAHLCDRRGSQRTSGCRSPSARKQQAPQSQRGQSRAVHDGFVSGSGAAPFSSILTPLPPLCSIAAGWVASGTGGTSRSFAGGDELASEAAAVRRGDGSPLATHSSQVHPRPLWRAACDRVRHLRCMETPHSHCTKPRSAREKSTPQKLQNATPLRLFRSLRLLERITRMRSTSCCFSECGCACAASTSSCEGSHSSPEDAGDRHTGVIAPLFGRLCEREPDRAKHEARGLAQRVGIDPERVFRATDH